MESEAGEVSRTSRPNEEEGVVWRRLLVPAWIFLSQEKLKPGTFTGRQVD